MQRILVVGLRLAISFVLLWIASALFRHAIIDRAYRERCAERSEQPDVLTSPGQSILGAISLEHPLAWADLTWLAIVQELGRNQTAAVWDRVERWSDITTDLDPRYFTVYHSAAVNLTVYADRPNASDRLLLKGWSALPDRWELPMLLGYNAYFLRFDPQQASDYMRQAAELEGAPRFLAALAGRMRYHGGDEAGAIEMLETMISTLDGPAKQDAEERLLILKSQPRLHKYDEACAAWLRGHGTRPTAMELFQADKVGEEPVDLGGYEITFDEKCIARTGLSRVREFEALNQLTKGAKIETSSSADHGPKP